MAKTDRLWLALLALAAAFVWLHDRAWLAAPDDALPLLAGLPLFGWLVAPWQTVTGPSRPARAPLAVGGVMFFLGLVAGLNLLLALGWTFVLWAWLGARLAPDSRERARRLLPLAVLAFPWLTLDFPGLGWWCRLSAAWSAEQIFQLVGFAVQREGTQVFISQMPFDVTPACSGIKALQAILTAGTALCFLQAGTTRVYWLGLAVLPLIAWVANTSRVLTILAAALSFGPEFATGWFHGVGGWVVIVGVFATTWFALDRARVYFSRKAGA